MKKMIDISGDLIDNEKNVYEKYSGELRKGGKMKKIEVFKMYTKKELINFYQRGWFPREELDEKIEIREGRLRAEIKNLKDNIKLLEKQIRYIEKTIKEYEDELIPLKKELNIIF